VALSTHTAPPFMDVDPSGCDQAFGPLFYAGQARRVDRQLVSPPREGLASRNQ